MSGESETPRPNPAERSFELASRNTGLAYQRTRLAADRTLMSVIRTALSLISFGFTISEVFRNLNANGLIKTGAGAGHHFGIALVLLGITMLVIGIVYHGQFMLALRGARNRMVADGLIRGESPFPASFTLITAIVLLAIGFVAILSMVFQIGPLE
jgi:putative membrane protein